MTNIARRNVWKRFCVVAAVLCALLLVVPVPGAVAADSGRRDMYRLYNPNSGEHFYTADGNERNSLVRVGWKYEGVGWVAPVRSNTPVYRLYNPNAGDHHYTTSGGERDSLVRVGWKYEGIGWYSSDSVRAYPLLRQYNPNARAGAHNFTLNGNEQNMLVRAGWKAEGIAWYGIGPGRSDSISIGGGGSTAVYFKNCTEAWRAGKAPLHRGDPGYGTHLDRDGDGIACEIRPNDV